MICIGRCNANVQIKGKKTKRPELLAFKDKKALLVETQSRTPFHGYLAPNFFFFCYKQTDLYSRRNPKGENGREEKKMLRRWKYPRCA